MGVGKSTTGPIVAAELGVGYYDTMTGWRRNQALQKTARVYDRRVVNCYRSDCDSGDDFDCVIQRHSDEGK